jgi:hypothetical protein
MRKPIQRMAFVDEVHSDNEQDDNGAHWVRQKPGRNPIVTRFFTENIDVPTEEYRKRNAKGGQKYVF